MEELIFYRQIEHKTCEKCQCQMSEQAECYVNVCDTCLPEFEFTATR